MKRETDRNNKINESELSRFNNIQNEYNINRLIIKKRKRAANLYREAYKVKKHFI